MDTIEILTRLVSLPKSFTAETTGLRASHDAFRNSPSQPNGKTIDAAEISLEKRVSLL
jgi:hypothetical protein